MAEPRARQKVNLELNEADRQLILLALAVLSLASPGFDNVLNTIALRIDMDVAGRAVVYDAFRASRRGTVVSVPGDG